MVLFLVQNTNRGATRGRDKRRSHRRKNGEDSVGKYFGDAWSLAKRTANGLNEIRKLINVETKFHDRTQTAFAVSTTGGGYCISQLAQGLTSTDRVGDSIKLQHIEFTGRIVANASAAQSLVRVLCFRDLDGYGTAPTYADVCEYDASVSAPLSPYKFNKKQRFSILFDDLITIQSSTGISSVSFQFKTAHEGHVLYLGTTAAAGSDGKGSIYLFFVSDEATNTPTAAFVSRITYTDD